MVSEEIRRLQATMDGLLREQADRRALRERQGEDIKARSDEYMTKQVQAAERYVQLRRELGRQEEQPDDGITELDFEPEGFAESGEDTPQPPAPPAPAPAAPAPPKAPAAPVPAPERPARQARQEVDEDDDDFLNNRWMDDA